MKLPLRITHSLLIVLFLLVSGSASAQTDGYRTDMNAVFANVDKTAVTTGYLSEYAYPFMPLENFNGTAAANNVNNRSIWQQVYATWHSAYITNATNPNPTPAAVNTAIRNAATAAGTAIPVPLLYARYNTLRPDAVTANLLRVTGNQLFDVAGRTQSPYNTNTLFAAAPANNLAPSNAVRLLFNTSLIYGNLGTGGSIAVDFGDGTYRAVTLGTPISYTYTTAGSKRIKVRFTPTLGSMVENHFDLQVLRADVCTTCRYGFTPSVLPRVFAGTANHFGGTVSARFSVNNTTGRIRKPLIIAEGYDVSSVAPLLQPNYEYRDFILAINRIQGGANPDTYDFSTALDNTGSYDLVFLDYNNGTDDIRRNAVLLQEVIRWVNAEKAAGGSIEQNVVLGQSMGGLVARYALAQMVRNNEATGTRLLICHDSPHRGANTPLGFQIAARAAAGINFFGFSAADAIPQLGEFVALSNAPATNQLLVVRATDANGTTANNTFLDNEYRAMINLAATPYKTIATSQGSQCGTQLFAPGTSLVNFNADGFLSFVPWISNTRYKTELSINALANQQSNQVLRLKIYSSWKILSLITINRTIFERIFNGPATLPYDGTAGSTQPARGQIPANVPLSGSYKVAWFLEAGYNAAIVENFTFVPTPSALDITAYNSASLSARYVNDLSLGNPSRFPKFIAQENFTRNNVNFSNEEHIRFTARNSQWLFNEMQQVAANTVGCTSECTADLSSLSVTGPSPLCGGTATYSVANLPPGTLVAWTSSNTSLMAFTNAATGLATRVGTGNGRVTLTATIGNCGLTVSGDITVGNAFSPTTNTFEYDPYGSYFSFACNSNDPTLTGYDWYIDNRLFATTAFAYVDYYAPPTLAAGTHQLSVVAINNCGRSARVTVRTFTTRTGGGSLRYVAYPNPADDEVNVVSVAAEAVGPSAPASTAPVSQTANASQVTVSESDIVASDADLVLVNAYNQVLWKGKLNKGKARFTTDGMREGMYYLQINDGKETFTRIISIRQ